MLSLWDERVKPDSEVTRGIAALRIMSKEKPSESALETLEAERDRRTSEKIEKGEAVARYSHRSRRP